MLLRQRKDAPLFRSFRGLEKTALGSGLTALGHVLVPVLKIGAATGIEIAPNGYTIAVAEPVRRGGGSARTVNRFEI